MSEKIETHNALLYFIDAEQMSLSCLVCIVQELLVMSMWRKISEVILLQIKAFVLFFALLLFFYFVYYYTLCVLDSFETDFNACKRNENKKKTLSKSISNAF